MPVSEVNDAEFDCIVFQSRAHYLEDAPRLLGPRHRNVPRVYLEHDPPLEHPTDTRHVVTDPSVHVVHVTHYNALMWDNGEAPVRVIEHGVVIPPGVRYTGEIPQGIAVVNHLRRRGRRLGLDVYRALSREVPLALIGMDAESEGGLGEVRNVDVPAFVSRYRFYFHPCRYTSWGLAACEAMMAGTPIVGLATTELPSVIASGVNGYADTSLPRLRDAMRTLVNDPGLAERWGLEARATALRRFHIDRFVADWLDLLAEACGETRAMAA
jgi:hypothetical protein